MRFSEELKVGHGTCRKSFLVHAASAATAQLLPSAWIKHSPSLQEAKRVRTGLMNATEQ